MKVIKAFTFGFALLAVLTNVSAQDNLTVVLKDGSELTGFISSQRPGENFTFSTSKAVVLLQSKDVKSIVDNVVNYSTLTPEWKDWAEKNDALEGTGDNKTLLLSDIITQNGYVNRVKILEKGAKVKYIELTPNNYSLSWDTIKVVKGEKRPKLLLSGINRRYKLSSGMEYEGQYIEEVPGETISLLFDNGVVQVFNTQDVIKDNRFKINPNQTLLEQACFIDIVQMNNGTSYKGVIFEKNYSENSEAANDYLLMEIENGVNISLNLADIVEYRKEKNPNYKPITDIELGDEEVAINRNIGKWGSVKEVSGIITASIDTIVLTIAPAKAINISAEFEMDNAKAQQLKLIKLREYQDKKGTIHYYGFSFEDMVKNAIIPKSVNTSINGITKVDFEFQSTEDGYYGVYDSQSNKIAIIRVTNINNSETATEPKAKPTTSKKSKKGKE